MIYDHGNTGDSTRCDIIWFQEYSKSEREERTAQNNDQSVEQIYADLSIGHSLHAPFQSLPFLIRVLLYLNIDLSFSYIFRLQE